MLFPRFSLRSTLLGITSCAFFFVALGQAVRGKSWAIVISVAVIVFLVTFLFHAMFYLLSLALTQVVGVQQSPARTSQGGLQSSSDRQSPALDNATSIAAAPTAEESLTKESKADESLAKESRTT